MWIRQNNTFRLISFHINYNILFIYKYKNWKKYGWIYIYIVLHVSSNLYYLLGLLYDVE